jgi:hypothetical protein
MPKTQLGKWSVVLIPVMVVLILVGSSLADSLYESVPAGRTIPADLLGRPLLAGSMLLGFAAGVTALVIGLISILKLKERAVLVFISTLIGLGVTLFLIAEIAFPH